jgi:hypothetical protein
MGFIDTSPVIPVLYNVIHAVGVNCPNKRDDVMMVQYLLLNFYKNVQPKEATPKGNMTVDGICGGITKNWIKKFQTDLMLRNLSIYADGRVDRIRNTASLTGSISNTIYTLAWLDWYVAQIAPVEYAALPLVVPTTNPNNVPPPSNDNVKPTTPPPEPSVVPATGGF